MNVNSIDMGEVYKLCIKTFGKDDTDIKNLLKIKKMINVYSKELMKT